MLKDKNTDIKEEAVTVDEKLSEAELGKEELEKIAGGGMGRPISRGLSAVVGSAPTNNL
jgi:hypothetical protein